MSTEQCNGSGLIKPDDRTAKKKADQNVAAAATVASTVALAAYLDGKFHIRQDLAAIRKARIATKAYNNLRVSFCPSSAAEC